MYTCTARECYTCIARESYTCIARQSYTCIARESYTCIAREMGKGTTGKPVFETFNRTFLYPLYLVRPQVLKQQ